MIKISNGWHALSVLVTLFVTEQAVVGALLSRKDNSLTRAAQTILFVDDADILYRSGTERILHPAKRASSNPIIRQDRPWEAAIGWMAVHRNPATGVYQVWYQTYAGVRAKRRSDRCVVCYAESRDGIHFTKPNLTLFPFNAIKETNIVLVANGGHSDRYGVSVVYDAKDNNPNRRYKMAYTDFSVDEGKEYPGLCVAFSPDGIRWTKYPKAPLHKTSYGDYESPVPFTDEIGHRLWDNPLTMADAVDVFYDPIRKSFVNYAKMWIDGPAGGMYWKHAMGRIESKDFIHWKDAELVLTPDDTDPSSVEFHTTPVFYYGSRYFSLNQILNRALGGGVIDIELMVSLDGWDWKRPFKKEFFLSRGEPGQYDSGSLFTNSTPVILEDEIRFYYGAYQGGATGGDDENMPSGIGFATIPRDRFAGIRPVRKSDQSTLSKPLERIGQITLKPLSLRGIKSISLNADVSKGSIRVELLSSRGRRIRGFSANECTPLSGDSLSHTVSWKGTSLSELPLEKYMIRIHLNSATVFALSLRRCPEITAS
ncbi:MAG: hypothetical protein NT023_16030 [Armatimonadetes bacterium]|nr:hypothetical protein [Armatimonadota bacterium]